MITLLNTNYKKRVLFLVDQVYLRFFLEIYEDFLEDSLSFGDKEFARMLSPIEATSTTALCHICLDKVTFYFA